MMKAINRCITGVALLGALAGCQEPGDQVLDLTSEGALQGVAYVDRDGNGIRSQSDVAFPNLRVSVLSGSNTVATTVTDTAGRFRVADLPVGTYRIDIDATTIGDTIEVVSIDSALVTIAANDTVPMLITLGYATATAVEVGKFTRGRRIGFTGTALNAWTSFGDSTVHVGDATGAIRVVGLRTTSIAAGDRVRLLATVGERDAVVALIDPVVISATPGELPAARDIDTGNGTQPADSLQSAQVRIRSAVVVDGASLAGGDVLLTVDDGSGSLEVLIDVNAGISPALPISRGAELDVTGVLVPVEGVPVRWRLKPRRTADVAVRYPVASIAAARAKQPGQYTVIHGVVLNDIETFGDNTLHVRDASASMRVFARPGFISAGDSVSVLGRVAVRETQPVLLEGVVSVIARRAVPPPVNVSIGRAKNADGGALDAALVRVSNVAVLDTLTLSGSNERRIRFAEGSDTLTVILDGDAGITTPMPAVGSRFHVTGLLVPSATGGIWILKPRAASDITAAGQP